MYAVKDGCTDVYAWASAEGIGLANARSIARSEGGTRGLGIADPCDWEAEANEGRGAERDVGVRVGGKGSGPSPCEGREREDGYGDPLGVDNGVPRYAAYA